MVIFHSYVSLPDDIWDTWLHISRVVDHPSKFLAFFFLADTNVFFFLAGYSPSLLLPILSAWGSQAGVWRYSAEDPPISAEIITTSLRPHWKSWLVLEMIPKWP